MVISKRDIAVKEVNRPQFLITPAGVPRTKSSYFRVNKHTELELTIMIKLTILELSRKDRTMSG